MGKDRNTVWPLGKGRSRRAGPRRGWGRRGGGRWWEHRGGTQGRKGREEGVVPDLANSGIAHRFASVTSKNWRCVWGGVPCLLFTDEAAELLEGGMLVGGRRP